jgi:hypothetical protein
MIQFHGHIMENNGREEISDIFNKNSVCTKIQL